MKQLKAKLYEPSFKSSEIRSERRRRSRNRLGFSDSFYVLDQSRIKDLRTSVEIGNTQSVLDGDIDKFIN